MDCLNFRMVLTAVLFAATFCNGDPGKSQEYDTIVVGMGAAGAVAASTLARAGKKVLALEAQDRIGGRVYTYPFGDGIVEVGAEWIHGTEDSRTYRTAMENNITLLPQDKEFEVKKSDGSLAGKEIDELLKKGFEFLEEKPDKRPQSVADFITNKLTHYMKEKTPRVYQDKDLVNRTLEIVRLLIEGYEAANDWNDLNQNKSYVSLKGHQRMSWHRNGYKTFFELLLNKYKGGPGLPSLDIKLNTEVTKIEWPQEAKGKVSVTTKDGTVYKAENVIVTVSLGVLKAKYRTLFSPALPQEKVTAIEKIQIGLIGKVIFTFPKAWWTKKNTYNGLLWKSDDLNKIAAEDKWTTKIVGVSTPMGSSNTLTMWTSGDVAKEVEIMPEDKIKTTCVKLLRRFIGSNVPEPTGMVRTKWYANEFTRGAYSYDSMLAADVPTARADLATPLKDSAGKPRVLFAGEASHTTRFSTVHGAADSGHREAVRLLEAK